MSNPQSPALDLAQFDGFTPGPWSAQHATGEVESDEGRICEVDQHDLYDDNGEREDAESDARMCANAELIAAAPALLAECKRQREEIARLRGALAMSVEAMDQFGKNFPVSGIKASIKSSEGFSQNLTHAVANTALQAARAALGVQG